MTAKQKHLLQLLREIDAICKKHGLRYVMAGGSLIGVVRHEGFVPWDDDVDLYMPRDDWNAFVSLSRSEFPPHRAIQCVDVTRNFTNTFPRYADTSSCVIHRHQIVADDMAGEIVDVLTLDPIPADDREYIKYRTHMMIYSELVGISVVYGARYEIPVTLYWKYLLSMKILGRNRTLKKLEKIMFSYKEEDCSRYAMRWGGCPFLFDKDLLFPVKYGKFEDLEVMIPARTSDYLIWHYGDEWSYIPDHEERTSHMAVTVEGAQYEDFRREYMPGLDKKKLWSEAIFRKSLSLITAKRDHRISDERIRLAGKGVAMDLKARIKKSGADLTRLREDHNFARLTHIFEKYFQAQYSPLFVGREDFVNITRFYHPILIEIPEDVFYTGVYTLFYTEQVAKAYRFLMVWRKTRGLNEEMKVLLKDIFRFRKAVGHYEAGESEEGEKLCKKLLIRYPAHPGLTRLECRFVMERGDTGESREFLKKAKELFPGDGYFLKYEADLLWKEGKQQQALELYRKARTSTRNGIVQLEMDKLFRQEKGKAMEQILDLFSEGRLEEAEEQLSLWRDLLGEDVSVQALTLTGKAAAAADEETLEELERQAAALLREYGEDEPYCRMALCAVLVKEGYPPALLEKTLGQQEPWDLTGEPEEQGLVEKIRGDILYRRGYTDQAFACYLKALSHPLPPYVREKIQKDILRDWYHGSRKAVQYASASDAGAYLDHWLGRYGSLEEIKKLSKELVSKGETL